MQSRPRRVSDTGGDGIIDTEDRCPDTPRDGIIDETGCAIPMDVDNDGVRGNEDRCPDTVAGVPVDARGCEVADEIRLQGVHFETNSERRAKTVRDLLINSGVADERLSWRGYGESGPIADNATAEGREQNRRVVLRILRR